MADKAKKYYTIDRQKMRVIIDESVNPSAAEEKTVAILAKSGYEVHIKSQARAAAMKKKSAGGPNKEEIEAAIKGDKDAEKTFNAILKGEQAGYKKGFFAAKKWYLKDYLPAKEKK